jgi:hypothetical protein
LKALANRHPRFIYDFVFVFLLSLSLKKTPPASDNGKSLECPPPLALPPASPPPLSPVTGHSAQIRRRRRKERKDESDLIKNIERTTVVQ